MNCEHSLCDIIKGAIIRNSKSACERGAGKDLLSRVELKESAGGAGRFYEALHAKGILSKETHDNVIRFAPPLVIDKETIGWALQSIREALNTK